jgi:hypothetical protein
MKFKPSHVLSGFAVCVALSPISVWASSPARSINHLEHREQVRIRQGIRSGELTRQEARRLEAEQARIRVNERYDRSDGKLTLKEREQLYKQLHHASRDIYRQKHDRQDLN